MKKIYPSDLTDNQWNQIKELFETEKQRGRATEINLRKVVNGILLDKNPDPQMLGKNLDSQNILIF